jgi:chromosome segregation ATPase
VVLTQQSHRLNRAVAITVLTPGAPRPMTRDERIQYFARISALEAELDELRGRAMTLQSSNRELAAQAKTDRAARAVIDRELDAARGTAVDLSQQLDLARRDLHATRAELDRLLAHDAAVASEPSPLHTL